MLEIWSNVLAASFQDLWSGVIAFVPKLVVALIIFIIGWVVAVVLGRLVSQLIRSLKVDRVLQGLGFEESLVKAGFRLDSGAFMGGLVRWFFIITFLVASVDVLGLDQVNIFLRGVVLLYLPNVFVAALILVVAALLADATQKIITGSAKATDVPSSEFLGGVAKWAIWLFAILAALAQIGVAGPFAETLFTGIVAMIAIAGGIAFGLGGKETASKYLEMLRKDINKN